MASIDSLIAVLNGTMEFFMVLFLINVLVGKRKNGICFFLVLIGASCCLALVNFLFIDEALMIVCYLLCFWYSFWLNDYRIKQTLIYIIFSFIFVSLLEMSFYFVNTIILQNIIDYQIITLISVVLSIVTCVLVRKLGFIKKIRGILESVERNVYTILAVGCFVFLIVFFNFKLTKEMQFYECLYLIVGFIVLGISVYKILYYHQELKIRKEYANSYKELITTIRERQHKFMNQINAVYSMINICDNYEELVDKQTEKLKYLEKYIMPGKLLVLESPLIIAHVYQKLCEAYEKNIEIETKIECTLHDARIPEMLQIEIIGNLLDNAIEEVMLRQRKEKIYLHITQKDGRKIVQVLNEHDRIPYKKYSQFFLEGYSSKGNNRGCGLTYLKKIVRKYNGKIEIGNTSYNNHNCFYVKVLL